MQNRIVADLQDRYELMTENFKKEEKVVSIVSLVCLSAHVQLINIRQLEKIQRSLNEQAKEYICQRKKQDTQYRKAQFKEVCVHVWSL